MKQSRHPSRSSRAQSFKSSAPRPDIVQPPTPPVASESAVPLVLYAPLPEWFRAWRQVVRNWWTRLKFIHTQVPFWERGEPSKVLRADVREARRLLKDHDLAGAIAALPAYRAPPSAPVTGVSTTPTDCRTKAFGKVR